MTDEIVTVLTMIIYVTSYIVIDLILERGKDEK